MNKFWYTQIFILLLSLPQAILASKYACDNSKIILRNQTNTLFRVSEYYPRANTELTLVQGSTTFPPGAELQFTTHSGPITWGEAYGVIKLQGNSREYELFYFFGNFFGLGKCSVRSEVTPNLYDFSSEHYRFLCEDSANKNSATLTCTIMLPNEHE